MGIGQRDTEVPNVLRVFLGEMEEQGQDPDVETREACLIECGSRRHESGALRRDCGAAL